MLFVAMSTAGCQQSTPVSSDAGGEYSDIDSSQTNQPDTDGDKGAGDDSAQGEAVEDEKSSAGHARSTAFETPVVLSYFWPAPNQRANPRELTMSTPNVIDILPGPSHGSPETRDLWRSRGKVLLNRVHPFRETFDPDKVYENFVVNMSSGAGISIDEILIHKYRPAVRELLSDSLERLRAQFPEQVIFAWDASRWDEKTAVYLRRIVEVVDAFAIEIYISKDDARRSGLAEFKTRLTEIESLAPGVRSKALIGIGAYRKMRDDETDDLGEHLAMQIRHIGCDPFFRGILGVAIYAPVYLSVEEQATLDAAIRKYIVTDPAQRDCGADAARVSLLLQR